jgi:hypothetical protein
MAEVGQFFLAEMRRCLELRIPRASRGDPSPSPPNSAPLFPVRKTERRHGGVIETLGHRRSLRERGRAFCAGLMFTPFAQRKFNAIFKS